MFPIRCITRVPAILALLAGGAVAKGGDKPVDMQWKMEPSGRHYIEETSTVVQKNPSGEAGAPDSRMVQSIGFWEEVKKGEGGRATMTLTIDRFGQDITMFYGGGYAYDTDRPQAPNASPVLKPVFDALVGQSFTLEFKTDGTAGDVGGGEALRGHMIEKCGGSPVWKQLQGDWEDEALRTYWGDNRMALHARRSVKPGDTWTGKTRRGYPFGVLACEWTFKLEEITSRDGREVARVSFKGDAASEPLSDPVAELIAPKAKGELVGEAIYDIAAGLMVEQTSRVSLLFTVNRPGIDAKRTFAAEIKTETRVYSAEERERRKKEAAAGEAGNADRAAAPKDAQGGEEKNAPKGESKKAETAEPKVPNPSKVKGDSSTNPNVDESK